MRDPESTPIGHAIPRGAKLLSILSGYENLPDAIPCGLPHCHVKHNNGFVVDFVTLDGRPGQGMIGHVCGKSHFGEVDWARHMKEHRVRENLASLNGQVEGLIEDCEHLLPVIEPLTNIADVVDKARRRLDSSAKELYRICGKACRRDNGLITHHGATRMEVRLRHRGFWTATEVPLRLERLKVHFRGFAGIAKAATTPERLSDVISKLGLPYDRARGILAELDEGLRALEVANIAEILPVVNEISYIQAFRMDGSVLEVCDHPSWSKDWAVVLNLEFYERHVKRLARVQEAVSNRREAA